MAIFGGMIYNRKSANLIPRGGAELIFGFTPRMPAAKGAWAVAGAYPTFRGPTRKYNSPELPVTGYVNENVVAKGRGITPINFATDVLSEAFTYDGQKWLCGRRLEPQGVPSGGNDYWTLPLDLSSSFAPNTSGQTWYWFEEHCILDALHNVSGFFSYYNWNSGLQGNFQVVSLAAHNVNSGGILDISSPGIKARWTSGAFNNLNTNTSDFFQTLNGSYGASPRAATYKRMVYVFEYKGGPGGTFNGWLYVKSASGITSAVLLGTKAAVDRSALTWDKTFYADPCLRMGCGYDGFSYADNHGGRSIGAVGLLRGVLSSGSRDAIAAAMLNNAKW